MTLQIADGKLQIGILALCLSACAAHPEHSTLDEFFNASKLLDKTALAHMATVIFDPAENGIVETFDVANVRDDGDARKVVTTGARVKLPGRSDASEETIVVTLTKNALPNDRLARDRWIVTGFAARLGTPPTRRP